MEPRPRLKVFFFLPFHPAQKWGKIWGGRRSRMRNKNAPLSQMRRLPPPPQKRNEGSV